MALRYLNRVKCWYKTRQMNLDLRVLSLLANFNQQLSALLDDSVRNTVLCSINTARFSLVPRPDHETMLVNF